MTFSSGMSLFTYGENFTAQVTPAQGGSTLRVSGVGKIGGQLQQSTRTNKLLDGIFADVTNTLRQNATPTALAVVVTAPAGWHPDPTGSFERRYWDGLRWTEHASTPPGSHQRVHCHAPQAADRSRR